MPDRAERAEDQPSDHVPVVIELGPARPAA